MVTLENVRRKLGPGVEFRCDRFEASAGAHVALWGPSGCGKSTMLNLITGLLTPDAGKVVVDNTEIQNMGDAALDAFRGQHFGFVFQTFNLLKPFTALQNVMLGMQFSDTQPQNVWKSRATELLQRVGLGHRLHAKPTTMSVGEQQRVAIARALVADPTLLICDEPTGDLDRDTADEILDLLALLNREHGKTIVMVTHDPKAAEFASRTLHLEKGQLLEQAAAVA